MLNTAPCSPFKTLAGPVALRLYALAAQRKQQVSAWAANIEPADPTVLARPARAIKDSRKIVVITGPTAVGKTRASLAVAQRLGGEIISADSVQVYRGLDVGSDKAPVGDRCGIAHHLLDVLQPHEDFSAAEFFRRARKASVDILERGKTPIVVGGTGFYLRWFVHGRPQTPAPDPQTAARAQATLDQAWLEAQQAKGGPLTAQERWEAGAQAIAAAGDPVAADKIRTEPNNDYRMRRVLEILLQTGRTMADMDLDLQAPLDHDFRCFFLHSRRRTLLQRIDARCEGMVTRGLLEEAQGLLDQGIQPGSNCASKSIGYCQAMTYLQRCRQDPSLISAQGLLQMVTEMQNASRQLSKRQMNWFRGDDMYQWMDAARPMDEIVEDIVSSVQAERPPGREVESGYLSKAELQELRRYQPVFVQLHGDTLEQAVERVRCIVDQAQASAAAQ